MTTSKLVKKYELYLKLNGGLERQDIAVQDCTKCLLLGVCKPEFSRKAFIKIEEGKSMKIIGYGIDFGIEEYVEDDRTGKIIFRVVKPCMEWLDQEPRIFEK